MRLSPRDPFIYSYMLFKGRGLFMLGRDEQAIRLMRRSVALNPHNQQGLIHLAAVLGATGREAEAREVLKAFLALKYARSRTIALWKQELRTTNAKYVATFERLTEGLRKAGLPEN
jgi:adenylate cyclase